MSTATSRAIDGFAGDIVRAPFARRTWADNLYVLVGFPLAVAGFAYTLVLIIVGGALAFIPLGLAIMASGVVGARGFGVLHRGLARNLLGQAVGEPSPRRQRSGMQGWTRSALRDGTSWRAVAYLAAKVPIAALTLFFSAIFWIYGFFLVTYPMLWRPVFGSMNGEPHSPQLWGLKVDTWPSDAATVALGAILLFLAPWVTGSLLTLERLLVTGLLGPNKLSERVRDLEETRAHAIDDAAARLRQIERDLHDGAQARLVAVTMKLTIVRDKLKGPDVDIALVGDLVDAAHLYATEALTELRDLVRGLHPPVLDSGLDAALASLTARSPVPVTVHVEIRERPTAAIETIAYFCMAELLTNVAKHSGAGQAKVDVTQRDGLLRLRVSDDGAGGARIGDEITAGGLAGLADRIRTVDGRLEVASPHGGPTSITVELPAHA